MCSSSLPSEPPTWSNQPRSGSIEIDCAEEGHSRPTWNASIGSAQQSPALKQLLVCLRAVYQIDSVCTTSDVSAARPTVILIANAVLQTPATGKLSCWQPGTPLPGWKYHAVFVVCHHKLERSRMKDRRVALCRKYKAVVDLRVNKRVQRDEATSRFFRAQIGDLKFAQLNRVFSGVLTCTAHGVT